MAEAHGEDRRPAVRVEPGRRQRAWPWRLALDVLAVGLLLFGVLYWGWGFVPFALIGLVASSWRLLWARRPGAGEIRGDLVIPKTNWWQDSRAVLTVANGGVRLRRAFEPEAWDVPWASIDEFLIEGVRPCRLTLMLDGAPLAQMTAYVDRDLLIAWLDASPVAEGANRS